MSMEVFPERHPTPNKTYTDAELEGLVTIGPAAEPLDDPTGVEAAAKARITELEARKAVLEEGLAGVPVELRDELQDRWSDELETIQSELDEAAEAEVDAGLENDFAPITPKQPPEPGATSPEELEAAAAAEMAELAEDRATMYVKSRSTEELQAASREVDAFAKLTGQSAHDAWVNLDEGSREVFKRVFAVPEPFVIPEAVKGTTDTTEEE